MSREKLWKLVWNIRDKHTGKQDFNVLMGPTIEEACQAAGIGRGALPAVDHYQEIQDQLPQEEVIEHIARLGCIPPHHDCPFRSKCEIAQGGQCMHHGAEHMASFSCAAARGFVITEEKKELANGNV